MGIALHEHYPFWLRCATLATLNALPVVPDWVVKACNQLFDEMLPMAHQYQADLFYYAVTNWPLQTDYWAVNRRRMCVFYNWFLAGTALKTDRTMKILFSLQAVLQVESAIWRELPMPLLKRFVEGDRSRELIEKLVALGEELLVDPRHSVLSLDDIWEAFRYTMVDLLGGRETDVGQLCCWLNRGGKGALYSMTAGRLMVSFQEKRRVAFVDKKVIINGTTYPFLRFLGKKDAEGRGFLSGVVEKNGGQFVARFGPHPFSNYPLWIDPESAVRYFEERQAEITPAPLWKKIMWLFPPLMPEAIIDGVALLRVVHPFRVKWNVKAHSPQQIAFLKYVRSIFDEFRSRGLLPVSDGYRHLGFLQEGDGAGNVVQLYPISVDPYSEEGRELATYKFSGGGIQTFKLLKEEVEESDPWSLAEEVRMMADSLIQTSSLPELRPDADNKLIDQRNVVSRVVQALKVEGFDEKDVYRVVGEWIKYTGAVRLDLWGGTLTKQIRHLLKRKNDIDYPLSEELLPLFSKLLENPSANLEGDEDNLLRSSTMDTAEALQEIWNSC